MAKSTGSGHHARHGLRFELQAGKVGKTSSWNYFAMDSRYHLLVACSLGHADTPGKGCLAKSNSGRCTAKYKGNLDAFVREKGMLGGANMRKGAAGRILGVDIFYPIECTMVDFLGGVF